MKLVLITGMSGAGKGVALKSLEDAGFEAIDNLPLSFLPAIVGATDAAQNLVVVTDIRSRDFSKERFRQIVEPLAKRGGIELRIVYIDCSDEVIQRRYTETRRRHPLSLDRPVMDGIAQERARMEPLRELADLIIDTSELPPQELRRILTGHFASREKALAVSVVSFSYKHGLPREADLVFDVRFLKNPHYVEELRPLTGRDAGVGNYIETDEGFAPFFENLKGLLAPLLPRYLEEGKHYLTIAVGCTGGRHRSVFVAEKLGEWLRGKSYAAQVRHREG